MTKTKMADQILSRRGDVEPFHAMDVLAQANVLKENGADIDYLCVGQPSAPAPKAALDAARNLLSGGVVSYTDAAGRLDLRREISEFILKRYGQEVSSDRIFITTGSSAGFNLAFLSLFDPGDRVAIATPGYPAYRNILKALSLEVVEIETTEEDRWAISPQALAKEHSRKPLNGILIASPANPSGTMMSPQALKELVFACDDLNIRFISDEIYHGLIYPEQSGIAEATALEFSDQPIIINSFSKYFCMTGWRIGWMVLPQSMVRPVERLAQSLYISAPELSQVAAAAALQATDELDLIRNQYLENRALLLDRLPKMGFANILPIDGAFYAYADATQHTNDSMVLARKILNEAHVAVTPGLDFDVERGHRYLRFSFAGSQQTIKRALDKIETLLL